MILVTGGTGFVGRRVVHALRNEGREVRVLVRDPRRAQRLGSVDVAEGDMADAGSLRRAVEGCEAIVHLVAMITGSARAMERVMSAGTRDLVAAAVEAGAGRFVLMSALGVDERTKDAVPYYRAKWEMEQAVERSGLAWTIFRPSFVFGPDGGVLPLFARQARLSPVIPVVGAGERRMQPIWVEDVGAFFARSLSTPASAGRRFDLGGPDVVTWNEFYDALARTLGKRRPKLHLPVPLMRGVATVLERLPNPPLTRDQLTMLELGDNVGDVGPALETFDVEPIGLDEQLRRSL